MQLHGLIRMLYAFGALLAVIGAVRINYKWNMGKEGIESEIAVWVGGILFLLLGIFVVQITFYDTGNYY